MQCGQCATSVLSFILDSLLLWHIYFQNLIQPEILGYLPHINPPVFWSACLPRQVRLSSSWEYYVTFSATWGCSVLGIASPRWNFLLYYLLCSWICFQLNNNNTDNMEQPMPKVVWVIESNPGSRQYFLVHRRASKYWSRAAALPLSEKGKPTPIPILVTDLS